MLIGIFVVPSLAWAYRHGPGKWERGMGSCMMSMRGTGFCVWNNPEMIEKLNLTDEQLNHLKEADFALRKNFLEKRSQMNHFKLEMQRAFAQENINDSEILELGKKMAGIQSEMFMNRVESRLELKNILTDEQFKMLESTPMGKFERDSGFGKYHGKMKGHWKRDMM
jgi:Spy/CpxP family protein refolding chaperone